MYIFKKYDYSLFETRFKDYGRLDQFPTGLRDLYQYLENLAEGLQAPIEVDVIELCCTYTEDSVENVLILYSLDSLDELKDNTTVLEIDDDTIIYEAY